MGIDRERPGKTWSMSSIETRGSGIRHLTRSERGDQTEGVIGRLTARRISVARMSSLPLRHAPEVAKVVRQAAELGVLVLADLNYILTATLERMPQAQQLVLG